MCVFCLYIKGRSYTLYWCQVEIKLLAGVFFLFFFSFAGSETLSTAVLMARNNSDRLDLVMPHSGLMTAKVWFYYTHLPECSRHGNKQLKTPLEIRAHASI